MELLKELYGKLPGDKIKIKWNENPIKMDEFLAFLMAPIIRSTDHLGCKNGWTKYENKELNLYISGGTIGGIEYLNSIQFGKKLSNPYNNYVNPFYLHTIISKNGIDFFKSYYEKEIADSINGLSRDIESTKSKLKNLTTCYNKIKGVLRHRKN